MTPKTAEGSSGNWCRALPVRARASGADFDFLFRWNMCLDALPVGCVSALWLLL